MASANMDDGDLVIPDGDLVIPDCLDLFREPTAQEGILKSSWVEYRSISQLGINEPLQFTIPSSGSQYIDLKKSFLRLKLKIVDGKGEDLPNATPVAFCNNILHTIWSNVEFQIGGKMISSSGVLYPYKAYFDTLLDFGLCPKLSHLQAQGFFPDTPKSFDLTDPSDKANVGLLARGVLSNGSKEFDLIGPLAVDIAQQGKLLLNGVNLSLRLWPSSPEFCMMATKGEGVTKFQFQITEAVLKVCKVTLASSVLISHAESFKRSDALYPYYKTLLKTETVTKGSLSHTIENIFLGEVPSMVTIGFVASEGFNGSFVRNPFKMDVSVVKKISLHVDDVSTPALPLKVDGERYIDAYQQLYSALGCFNEDQSIGISREDWGEGYGLFCFELAPNQFDKRAQSITKSANVRLNIEWNGTLPENYNVIIYAKTPSLISIDKSRKIVYK
jgi:hypothetical protein